VSRNFTIPVLADTSGGSGLVVPSRKVGWGINQGTTKQMHELAGFTGKTSIGATNRLYFMRVGQDWNAVMPQGGVPSVRPGGGGAQADELSSNGMKTWIGAHYSSGPEVVTYTFDGGTSLAGDRIQYPSDYLTQFGADSAAAGGSATLSGGNFWNGPAPAAPSDGVSLQGPGIDFMELTGDTTNGSPVVQNVAMPAANANLPGAGVSWVGKYVSGPGMQTNTQIASISGTSVTLTKTANQTGSGKKLTFGGNYIGGVVRPRTIINKGSNYFQLSGGVTVGKTGTYRLGGTSFGRDSKLTPKPDRFGAWCGALVGLYGTDALIIEMNNEPNQPLGAMPWVNIPLQFKVYCNGWAASKAANPDCWVGSPGAAYKGATSTPNIKSMPDYFNLLMDEANGIGTTGSTYFSDTCKAYGVEALRLAKDSPLVPWDVTICHCYSNNPETTAASGDGLPLNQAAEVYNVIRSRGGSPTKPLPLCMGENFITQGWLETGGAGPWTNTQAGSAYAGALWIRLVADFTWGDQIWDKATQFAGTDGANLGKPLGDGTLGTVTRGVRRASARKVWWPFCGFAIVDVENPWGFFVGGQSNADGGISTRKYPAGDPPSATTVAAASNTASTTGTTLTVADASTYPTTGRVRVVTTDATTGNAYVIVAYTGKTGNQLTGCTRTKAVNDGGQVATYATGQAVYPFNNPRDAITYL
jgi:hypothetical protein